MRDYSLTTCGGVYELLDNRSGVSNGNLYVVVSSNEYHINTQDAIVAPVRPDGYYETPYKVPVVIYVGDQEYQYNVHPESLFNVRANRLTRFKFTLSDEVMDKVRKSIVRSIFGKDLYTMEQASYNILQGMFKVEEPLLQIEKPESKVEKFNPVIDEESIPIDDLQKMYAKEQSKTIEIVYKAPESEVEVKAEPEKKSIGGRAPKVEIQNIKDHYQDFLLDYYTLPKSDVIIKWNITQSQLYSVSKTCREIAKKSGLDITMFNENQKRGRKIKCQK